jgi:cytochrome c oxidase subunit 2
MYACVLAGVVAFLLWVTFTSETPIDRTAAHPGVRIKVIAAQWSWRFIYPGGVTVADVDTWHPASAYLPTGTELEFVGSSEDVIHGFWVPGLHYQRQFVPGYTTRFDLLFSNPGYYGGECSVLCGEDHSEMHFALQAVSPQSFRAWLAREAARQGASA